MSDTHTAAIVVEPRARQIDRERLHPLVDAATQAGTFDPATLERLMDLQERWEANEAKKAFTRALAALKRDLPSVIQKDATVDYTSRKTGDRTYYKHASLAGVMDAITDPLTAHGFALSWVPSIGDRSVRVACRLTHTEGHHEEAILEAPADNSGNKSPAQAIASTITLLQRYTALALLGIATADMQDPPPSDGAEPDPDRIDAEKNMQAVRAIMKAGLSREDAEGYLSKPVSQWTQADRRDLKAWLDERRAKSEGAGEP